MKDLPEYARVGLARGHASYDPADVEQLLEAALHAAGDPLDSLVSPDQTVFLKPNWIAGSRAGKPDEWIQIITHPSVLEAMLEQVARRLTRGRIVIGDAPQTDSDFSLIESRFDFAQIIETFTGRWPEITLTILDLRREYWVQRSGVTVRRIALPGDPAGAVAIDLADRSEFASDAANHEYYGADYDFADTRSHHRDGHHRYLISRSVLEADVFINLPKLKTHKKAGLTLSLKNLVGVNADKNYLPHYSLGPPAAGGDEFPDRSLKRRIESWGSRTLKALITRAGGRAPVWGPLARGIGIRFFGPTSKVVRSGNWHGNDTLWRMCLDLNKIVLWYDAEGRPRERAKPYLSVVDGIVGGHGDGPVDAAPFELGTLVAGRDPLAVDLVCARLVGFDWRKIPILRNVMDASEPRISSLSPQDVRVTIAGRDEHLGLESLEPFGVMQPHFGWRDHIEL